MSGQQLLDVREPVDAADQVGALGEAGRVLGVEVEVATHARGRVDHDVDAAVPDPLDDLAVERHLAGAVAAARIPHVHVDDGGARPGRLDAGLGDLLRGHGHVLGLADRVPRAGQRARDDDLAIHLDLSREAVATRAAMAGSVAVGQVAALRVVGGVGVRPGRGLRRRPSARPVDVDELAAAAVRATRVPGVVERPPVLAEPDVGRQRAGRRARAQERMRRAGRLASTQPRSSRRSPPGTVPSICRSPTRAQSGRGGATPPPASATPSPSTPTTASSVHPRSRHSSRQSASGRRRRWRVRAPSRAPASRPCSRRSGYPAGTAAGPGRSTARDDPPAANAPTQRGRRAVRVAVVLHPVHAAGHASTSRTGTPR